MKEHHYIPEGRLTDYIKFMWYSRDYVPWSDRERVLPNGASQLIINLGDKYFRHFGGADVENIKEFSSAVLTGIHTHNIFMDPFSRTTTIGAVLKPGAIPALFDLPAVEFKNRVVSLQSLNVDVCPLREKLIEATDPDLKFKLLESFFTRQLDRSFVPNPGVMYAIKQLDQQNGLLTITALCNKVGYSRRHFAEVFKKLLGTTPKQYASLCRFQYALRRIRNANAPQWPSVGTACGYYDQSHFIHEFKSFSGLLPTEYHQNKTDMVNHLLI